MKYFYIFLFVSVGLLSGIVSCSSSKKAGPDTRDEAGNTRGEVSEITGELAEPVHTIVPDTFVLPPIPQTITVPQERTEYLTMHYWDRFDFGDRKMIDRPEITEQAFVDYINILHHVPKESADKSVEYTLNKAAVDTVMYGHFATLFEKYLYDPNSPFRNEELYLPVLHEYTNSPLLTEERRSVFLFQLDMALKNRVGQKARNFAYTLPSGQSYTLYDLKSEYTLLMFSNPGCSTCEAVTKQLGQSKELSGALSLNSPGRTMLTILTIYPDNDLEEWLAHLDKMPTAWIHGYDKGMKITHEKLYDIKAIPTLYLLDSNKNVILKDTSIESLEAFFSLSG